MYIYFPRGIFATQLSSQAVYFIQTGGSALSNTYKHVIIHLEENITSYFILIFIKLHTATSRVWPW